MDEKLEYIEKQKQEYSKQFDELNKQIEETLNSYNEKITKLRDEGEAKLAELRDERERIRGGYMALQDMYQQVMGEPTEPDSCNCDNCSCEEANQEPVQPQQPIVEVQPVVEPTPVVEQPVQPAETQTLTPDEIAKIKQIENDTLDYLK